MIQRRSTGTGQEVSLYGASFEDECARDVKFDKQAFSLWLTRVLAQRQPIFHHTQLLGCTPPVFGEVIEGMDVVKLEGVKGAGDRPVEEQKIISTTICE